MRGFCIEREFLFGDHGTLHEWGLLLTHKDITPPEPKTSYIELDGMSGSLDLSEALSGEVTYRDRIVTASFWTCNGTHYEREKLLRHITATLHGRKMKIFEPDDSAHYFYGRVSIVYQKNTQAFAEFTIEAVCDPWRYERPAHESIIDVSGTEPKAWTYWNGGVKTICPDITVEGDVTFTCNGVTSEATTGQYKITTFKLFPGHNTIMFSGNGTVTLRFREATL